MAELALVFSTVGLMFGMWAFLKVAAFMRGYRILEKWLWDRQVSKLERSLDDEKG